MKQDTPPPITTEDMLRAIDGPIDTLERNGITLEMLAKKLKRELNAKTTRFFQKDGKVVEMYDVIDWTTRQNARQDAHKLRGDYPAAKQDVRVNGKGVKIDIHLTPKPTEDAENDG